MDEWRISNSALLKILATVALVYVLIKLYPLLVLLGMALLIGCSLYPIIKFLERRMPHWAASALVALSVFAILIGVVVVVIPTLGEQFSVMAKRLPEIKAALMKNAPGGMGQKFMTQLTQTSMIKPEHIVTAGQGFAGALADLVLVVVIALYLASDGERTYAWLKAFFSKAHAKQIDETAKESTKIIVAYVFGQVVTSVLCAVFVFVVLKSLNVPAALVLALLAAIFDVLPMLGFFLFAIPAVLFALTVSLKAALTVLVLYFVYHQLEAYVIVPKVYGNRLRLSDFVVLASVLAGAYLGGIPGAIFSLPLVAIYPAVERIWLVNYVGRDVVSKHKEVESSTES